MSERTIEDKKRERARISSRMRTRKGRECGQKEDEDKMRNRDKKGHGKVENRT